MHGCVRAAADTMYCLLAHQNRDPLSLLHAALLRHLHTVKHLHTVTPLHTVTGQHA